MADALDPGALKASIQFLGWVAESYEAMVHADDHPEIVEAKLGSAQMARDHADAIRAYLAALPKEAVAWAKPNLQANLDRYGEDTVRRERVELGVWTVPLYAYPTDARAAGNQHAKMLQQLLDSGWEPDVEEALLAGIRALSSQPSPDAGGTEALTEEGLRKIAKERGWYVREGTSVPVPFGGWRHPFSITVESSDLVDFLAALRAKTTEAVHE